MNSGESWEDDQNHDHEDDRSELSSVVVTLPGENKE